MLVFAGSSTEASHLSMQVQGILAGLEEGRPAWDHITSGLAERCSILQTT